MSRNITITIDKTNLHARLDGLQGVLTRGQAAKVGGMEMEGVIKDHVGRLARSRHKTAYRIEGGPVSPTGHYREEAVNLTASDANSATVAVSIPGIARAYRDITIRPKRAKSLTIPIHAWAYGRTVREVRDSGMPVFEIKGKGVDVLATARGGELINLYLLRKVVHQPRDRSLMPTTKRLEQAFGDGVLMAVEHYDKGAAQ